MSRKQQKARQQAALTLLNSIPTTASVVHPMAKPMPLFLNHRTVPASHKKVTPVANYFVAHGNLYFAPLRKLAA